MRVIDGVRLAALGVLGCAPASQPPEPAASAAPALQLPAFPTDPIGRWVECEECQDGELAAVVAMGAAAVPALATFLAQGPPADRIALLEQALRESHAKLSGDSQALSQAEYVARYRGNYLAKYQTRAAMALGTLRTPEALRSLAAVDTASMRIDVRAAVRDALRRGR